MPTVPFAFSVHHFISSVGADAGFAAIIGLALLVLLFFAQARETATLRRRADEAEQQLDQLEAYVDQLARMGAVAQSPAAVRAGVTPPPASAARAVPAAKLSPRVIAAAVPSVSRVAPAPALPFAPAGVGAPALASATRLIPLADVPLHDVAERADVDGEPAIAAASAAGPITAVRAAAAEPAGGNTVLMDPPVPAAAIASAAVPVTPAPVLDPPAPRPSTAAAGAVTAAVAASAPASGGNGASSLGSAPVAPPPIGFAPAAPPADLDDVPPPRVRLRPHVPGHGRPAAPASRRPQGGSPPPGGRHRGGRVAVAVAAVLAVVVVGVGWLLIGGGSTSSNSSAQTTPSGGSASASSSAAASTQAGSKHGKHGKHSATAVAATASPPASVTVSVLNGTGTPGLAATVMSKLTQAGYQPGTTNNSQAQHSTTIVEFASAADKADAVAVAKALSLNASSVQAATATDLAVACGATPSACPSKVVVTVGADLASGT